MFPYFEDKYAYKKPSRISCGQTLIMSSEAALPIKSLFTKAVLPTEPERVIKVQPSFNAYDCKSFVLFLEINSTFGSSF